MYMHLYTKLILLFTITNCRKIRTSRHHFLHDSNSTEITPDSTTRYYPPDSTTRNYYELLPNFENRDAILKQIKETSRTPEDLNQLLKNIEKIQTNSEFKQAALSHMKFVFQYERLDVREAAFGVLSDKLSSLHNDAMNSMKENHMKENQTKEKYGYHYAFLQKLLNWFKNEFFTWVKHAPVCSNPDCKYHQNEVSSTPEIQRAQANGVDSPSTYERDYLLADHVELYKCNNCNKPIRFPRVNNVIALLTKPEYRMGRCGEWVNAFTAILRTLGYDARFVYDETDHVWSEVFLPGVEGGRQIHLDCSEGKMDQPELYECNWGKKLHHVFAFGISGALDVTKRYAVRNWEQTKKARLIPSYLHNAESEETTSRFMMELDQILLHFYSNRVPEALKPKIMEKLRTRRIEELSELENISKVTSQCEAYNEKVETSEPRGRLSGFEKAEDKRYQHSVKRGSTALIQMEDVTPRRRCSSIWL